MGEFQKEKDVENRCSIYTAVVLSRQGYGVCVTPNRPLSRRVCLLEHVCGWVFNDSTVRTAVC